MGGPGADICRMLWMKVREYTYLSTRSLRYGMEQGWEEKADGPRVWGPALLVSRVPARSFKPSKNSQVQPGLAGCNEDTFVKVGG